MQTITPLRFWKFYREALRTELSRPDAWQNYKRDKLWTPIAIRSAEKACADLELKTEHEYYRVDLIGYESQPKFHNWTLRVAFEHENRDSWWDELCKLTHVVADLCVLASYYDFRRQVTPESALAAAMTRINFAERNGRVSGRQWLFIFGPRCVSIDKPFRAITLGPCGELAPVDEGDPLFIRAAPEPTLADPQPAPPDDTP